MSDDISRPPSPPDPLPSELLGIENQVLADGAAWEQGVPPAASFTLRIRSVLQEDSMRDSEIPAETDTVTDELPALRSSTPRHNPRTPSRWQALVGTVAAVVIVALLGAVFVTLANNHKNPGVGSTIPTQSPKPPTPTPAATPLPKIGVLARQPSATNQPGIPIVAQSNPHYMYEYADNEPGPVLRRSEDSGKTWNDLAFPQNTNSLGAEYLAVSPIDAMVLFLEMDVNLPTGGSCQVHADSRGSLISSSGGGTLCRLTYRSEDAGNIWQPISFPINGSIFGNGVTFSFDSTAIQAQNNRLYVRVHDKLNLTNPMLDIRIFSTADGGSTWQAADTALASQAPHVCSFAATPVGSTLFAVSAPSCTGTSGGTLWRSDDAGVTWNRVGNAPDWSLPVGAELAMPTLVGANVNGDPSQPLLYAEQMPDPVTLPSNTIVVSADGGKTWQKAPNTGLPHGAQIVVTGSAPLPDGSIVVAFTDAISQAPRPIGCYYWSPGESAWQRITPDLSLTANDLSNVFVSSTTAGVTVTLSIGDSTTTSPLYTIQPFA